MDASARYQPFNAQEAPLKVGFGRGSSWEALLAALPHLWLALSVAVSILGPTVLPAGSSELVTRFTIGSRVLFIIVALGVMLYAWQRAWPLWSASWYFYFAWLAIILLASLLAQIGQTNWIINFVLILGGLAGMALFSLLLFRRSRLHALLAALFLMPVATQFELESIPNPLEAVLALLFGLFAAAVAFMVVRTRSWELGTLFALAANFMAGVALTYISFYRSEIPGFYGDSVDEALMSFGVYFGLAVALFTGPWLVWAIYDRIVSRKRGPA